MLGKSFVMDISQLKHGYAKPIVNLKKIIQQNAPSFLQCTEALFVIHLTSPLTPMTTKNRVVSAIFLDAPNLLIIEGK